MLYLVSTPIGNLGDLSPRARQVLEEADLVACEDTRTSGQLFALLGIKVAAMMPYHEHNADKMRPKLIEKMLHGVKVALVSDAGTPLVSDPGYKLVRACYDAGIQVTSVPGANAVLTALQLSGLPSNAFYFAGFLPPKSAGRRTALQAIAGLKATLIIYETPNRLAAALADIEAVLGNRPMAVVRELTKKFEEVRRGCVAELAAYYAEVGEPKGELVLVIGGKEDEVPLWSEAAVRDLILEALKTKTPRDTADCVAKETGLPRKEIYQQVIRYAKK